MQRLRFLYTSMNYTFNTCRYDTLMSFYPLSNFDIAHMRKDASVSLPTQLHLHPKAGEPNTEKKYEYTSPSKRLSEVVLWVGKVGLNGPGVGEREKFELDLFDTSRSPAPFFLLLRILSNLTSSLFSCCCIVAKICKIGDPKSHQSKRMSAICVWLTFCKYWFIPAVPAEDSEWAWDQEISHLHDCESRKCCNITIH